MTAKTKFASVLLGVFIAAVIAAAVWGVWCASSLSRFSSASLSAGTSPASGSGPVNILVTGTDLSKSRTDTIMILSLDRSAGTLTVVSVPRDTLVTINGARNKINAANVLGGAKLLVSKVQELTGVTVNYYATVDYAGFDGLVDSVGGVDMTIPYNMNYDDPAQDLHIHFTKGAKMHLGGRQAEEFFRWRKNNDGTGLAEGDIGRTGNQHLMVAAIFSKLKTPLNIARMPSILSSASKYVKTDMSPGDIVKYGSAIMRVKKQNITFATLKGSTPYIGGISYFVYNAKENAALIAKLK